VTIVTVIFTHSRVGTAPCVCPNGVRFRVFKKTSKNIENMKKQWVFLCVFCFLLFLKARIADKTGRHGVCPYVCLYSHFHYLLPAVLDTLAREKKEKRFFFLFSPHLFVSL
jgi:hypothetical protein